MSDTSEKRIEANEIDKKGKQQKWGWGGEAGTNEGELKGFSGTCCGASRTKVATG